MCIVGYACMNFIFDLMDISAGTYYCKDYLGLLFAVYHSYFIDE